MNELHVAARDGSIERTVAVISRGAVDIDQGTPEGFTALMLAATSGRLRVARLLLNKGANVSIVNDNGFAALHFSAYGGHLAMTKLLVKAGADLEAKTSNGFTPLDLAEQEGHSEVMGVLIEAGANPNNRRSDSGATPLYSAAQRGHLAATKVLLHAKANPLLTFSSPSGGTCIPLDVAAHNGHLEVVGELIQEYGIEGCGGESGGVNALRCAAKNQHVEVMDMLTSDGVVDSGLALITAASFGLESSVKFLLQQQQKGKASGHGAGYLNFFGRAGATPLVCSIQTCRSCSPRIARLLVDAGADTTAAVRLTAPGGLVCFNGTPLALVDKKIGGKEATEGQLHSLEAIRRLLLRVEAVHAVSWLWVRDAPPTTHAAAEGTGRATKTTATPLVSILPVLRRRAGRPRVLLAALFRNSTKP